MESRLQRIDDGDLDATILAYPVLARLGLAGHVTELIEPTVIAPTPGQGALVIEVADSGVSPSLARALSRVDHLPSRIRAMAERALQERLEAGTRAPFGCLAAIVDPHDGTDSRSRLVLTAVVCDPDETKDVRRSRSTMLDDLDAADDVEVVIGIRERSLGIEQVASDVRIAKEPGRDVARR